MSGIVTAIVRADADLAPGTVRVNAGELHGASVNRSLAAFHRNPDRAAFPAAIDPAMTVLRLARGGAPVGVFSWFATHGTSMPNTSSLISGDNKGYAAYRWEHDWAGIPQSAKAAGAGGFVAGFAQGSAGDMSPNLGAGDSYGPTGNDFANTRVIGERQALAARALAEAATELVTGPIDHRQRYIDFSAVPIRGVPGARTWPAVIGQGFTAGTHDGRGLPFIRPGQLRRSPLFRLLDAAVVRAPAEVVAGHAPKPVGLATGLCRPDPWTPQILPVQVVRVGQVAIVAAPGEFTIMSGRRVRLAVAEQLPGVAHVIFAGYANGYAGYVTTPEEYDAQHYEGASTHFGRWTLPAYQQEFVALAAALHRGEPVPAGPTPPDLSGRQRTVDPGGRLPDLAPPGRRAGDVLRQPRPAYRRGDLVVATFHAGCPNHDTRNGSTYLEIQRDGGPAGWVTVAGDDDWETIFRWQRALPGLSTARIAWRIPAAAPPGRYRIVHHGAARDRAGAIRPYTGVSRPFTITG